VRKSPEKSTVFLTLNIIEKVNGPTTWLSPIVAVPKKSSTNDIRLCINMRRANSAIEREKHPIPKVEEIQPNLNNAKVFSNGNAIIRLN